MSDGSVQNILKRRRIMRLEILYSTNFSLTLFTSLTSLIIWGLLFLIPLGIFQISLLIYLLLSSKVKISHMKVHVVRYVVISTLILLLTFFVFTGAGLILWGPALGLFAAWYHVWITKQIVLLNRAEGLG